MNEQKYNELITKINLDKIELDSLNCKQNTDFRDTFGELDIALEHDIKSVDKDGVELRVQMGFEVAAAETKGTEKTIEDLSEERTLFKINFSLNLIYTFKVEDKIDFLLDLEEEIKVFVDNNVPVNAWPYARETISSITTRMGLPSLVIPPYKIGNF